jgi:hypothetical protein
LLFRFAKVSQTVKAQAAGIAVKGKKKFSRDFTVE